jgi:hypothetical protein
LWQRICGINIDTNGWDLLQTTSLEVLYSIFAKFTAHRVSRTDSIGFEHDDSGCLKGGQFGRMKEKEFSTSFRPTEIAVVNSPGLGFRG